MPKVRTSTNTGRKRQQTTADRGRLTPGEVVSGIISDYNYQEMTYSVNVRGQTYHGACDMTGVCTSLMGFKVTNRMAPGTNVIIVFGKPCWIIGARAEDAPDVASFMSRTMTGLEYPKAIETMEGAPTEVPAHNAPGDLYQGEFEIATLTGTFIRFLMFMTSLGGSERAKIECHLLRDLVRVVSRNFEHFSSSGDFKITDDGRLNMEMNGTSYDHERWGLQSAASPKFQTDSTGMPQDLDPLETGRWRYTMLVGFLGDLFNTWFTDPAATAGKMAEDALRSGKARVHVGQNGSVLVQSCADIVLERVTRVQVPIRLKHEEDPEGVLRKEMDQLDKSFLTMWKTKPENEHHQLFKVREYVRYLNQYQTLARIHQLASQKQEWKVPSEEETPPPEVGSKEVDREQANPGATYWKDCYSTIRIYKDGSTLILDAYGNATATGPYGIQLSSTRHIHLYAAGDIVQKAGGSVFISARRHVEITANRGSLLLKARTGLRALCEAGTLWLKSDFDPNNPYTPEDGDPEAETTAKQGIRIQATNGEGRWISKLTTRVVVNQAASALEIITKGLLKLRVDKNVEGKISGSGSLEFMKDLKVKASAFSGWFAKGAAIAGICSLTRSMCKFTRVEANALLARFRIGGPELSGMPKDGTCCYRSHTNHITVYDNPQGINDDLALDDNPPVSRLEDEPSADPWKLVPKEEYVWNNSGLDADKTDFDFEPLAQQALRLAEDSSNYQDWPKMTDKLLNAPETAADTPWPGEGFRWKIHNTSMPDLGTPSPQEAASFSASIETPLTSQPPVFKILKR